MNNDIATITATITALAAAANARAKTEAERIAEAFTRVEHAPIARVVERVNEGHAIDSQYRKPNAEEIALFANLKSYTVEIVAGFPADQQERIDARLATLKAAGIETTVEAYQGNWKQQSYAGVDPRNEDGTRRVFIATVNADINTRAWVKGNTATVIEITTRVLPFSESDRVIESTAVISAGVDHSAPFATDSKFLKRAAENARNAAGRYTFGIAGLDRLIASAAVRVARRDAIDAVQKVTKAYNGEGWNSTSTFPKAKTGESRPSETRLTYSVYNGKPAQGEVSQTGKLEITEATPAEALALIEFLKALRNA